MMTESTDVPMWLIQGKWRMEDVGEEMGRGGKGGRSEDWSEKQQRSEPLQGSGEGKKVEARCQWVRWRKR